MSEGPIYAHDAEPAADDLFEPGTLDRLVAGNRGRMLDARRTPVAIVGVEHSTGTFELTVEAFEDRGARWRLPVEDVRGFQFERGARRAPVAERERLEQLAARFDRTVEVKADAADAELTAQALTTERARIRPILAWRPELERIDLPRCVARREGSPEAAAALEQLIDAAGLTSLERSLARTYVSNPSSGEIVKGHSIVIAEMGVCPYSGPIVRDESLFVGDGAKPRRRAHVLLRLAFIAELMHLLGRTDVELFRGIAVAGPLEGPPRARSLVAATFSRAVANAHFETSAEVALLARQRVPVGRLLMTFLETREMNEHYREAEAVLLGDPANAVF
jgi:hypothetical protein